MINSDSDPLKKAQQIQQHLDQWLEHQKQAQDAIPYVNQLRENNAWVIDALTHRPAGSESIPLGEIPTLLEFELESVQRNLPLPPQYNSGGPFSSVVVSTSGNTAFYDFISQHSGLNTPDAESFTVKYKHQYQKLQTDQDRPHQVRRLLVRLGNQNTVDRFDHAATAFSAAQASVGSRADAAGAMRTTLDGVKGNLFARAKTLGGENMTWETMAHRLANNQPAARFQLIAQEKTHASLVSDLSTILKDREGSNQANLSDVWTRFLDHIFTVLGLIGVGD